jgi:DNA-binding CsgD family transcriptional regulator
LATETSGKLQIQSHIEAMAHPLRHRCWIILYGREASPKEIADELNADTALVSHHVKRLVKLDCAELVREEKVRGAVRHVYKATQRVLVDVDDWNRLIDENPPFAKHLLCGFMQSQLDDFRRSVQAGVLGSDDRWHITRDPAVVDDAGLTEALDLADRFQAELVEIVRRSAERRGGSGGGRDPDLGLPQRLQERFSLNLSDA